MARTRTRKPAKNETAGTITGTDARPKSGVQTAAKPVASKPTAKPKTASPEAESERVARPTRSRGDFPIAVIGASAGGLDALKRFLAAVPADSGIAFVLVPHLDPHHESLMVELLAKQTATPIHEAAHGDRIRPDHAYVIPPNKYLAIKRGRIELTPLPKGHGATTAIDHALSSAALDLGERAIGIILSGTGNHGVLGIKKIKLAGGLVLAQDPATAEFDQMPRSAFATGVVDYTLPPERMPDVLVRYARHWRTAEKAEVEPSDSALDALVRVFAILQARTKQDFRHYRKTMITRRIQRRMALLQIDGWDAYLEHLRANTDEVTALFHDLLIGVTAFFRDTEAFEALAEHALPKLVARATAEAPVRVWVPGCASGEEAYSIAILLFEQFRAAGRAAGIQIFATDIDEHSLETARQGVYPDSMTAAVSPELLKRFFVKVDQQHYQVSKQLRDSIVFAAQNLISDAPFSRLDLISCRNVLIYLEPKVQEKVISLLHFALSDGGYLFLGPSESIGRASGMFEPVVKKSRLYRRTGPARRDLVNIPIAANDERRARVAAPEPMRRSATGFPQLLQRLLAEDFAPASVLINRDYEILAVQGPLVSYLEFPPGEMTKDLLALARQGLRIRIRSACQQALREGRTIRETDARVRRNGGYVRCIVTARPTTEPKEAEGLLLVVFEDLVAEPPVQPEAKRGHVEESVLVQQLEKELRATRRDLQSTIEELEGSNEELKASNEEVMSMNEELQSTNEELETSKEELQSLNEELATVNSQLQDKVQDLDSANSDLTNLMAVTGIPTVFLDEEFKIKSFTPSTAKLFNLMAVDVGRPFRDFAVRFKDANLLRDAEGVLSTLAPSEKEVYADDGRSYLRRILPYRSIDGRIAGVVVTFFDVTSRVAAEARARQMATVLLDSNDAVTVCDLDGRITAWNDGAEQMFGYSETKALTMNIRELVPQDLQVRLADMLGGVARGQSFSLETQRLTRNGNLLDVWLTATPLRDGSGGVIAMATTERDVTARRRAEETIRSLNVTLERRVAERTAALEASEQRIRSVLDAATDAIVTIDAEGTIQTFNKSAEAMFGYPAEEAIGQNVGLLMGPPYRENHAMYLRRYRETREPHAIGRARELRARRKNGEEFPILLSVSEVPSLGLFTGIVRDITEQRTLQDEIVRIATLEQRRIGQELHDNTQQELTGLGLLAENLSESLRREGDAASEVAAKLAAGIAEANRRVRALAKGLVPVPVGREGLMSALGELARRTEETHGIPCRFECPEPVSVADDNTALQLYQIAREAVANAVKHSQAGTISLHLYGNDRNLNLDIRDDGVGLGRKPPREDGLGLRIMEHRCGLIGGQFSVRGGEPGGTVVSCVVPMVRRP
jgi:two-component system CheB/CheR fusion protein